MSGRLPQRAFRVLLGLFATAALLGGCSGGEGTASVSESIPVDIAVVEVEDVVQEVSTVASLDSERDARLRAEVKGRIREILAEEGAQVRTGAALVDIDSDQYRLDAEAARAGLVEARAQFENDSIRLDRFAKLRSTGAVDPQTFDDLRTRVATDRARVESARVRVETAERDLDRSRVPAPFNGTFVDREVDLGDYVAVGDGVGRLVDLDLLRLSFELPERIASAVVDGDEIRFTVAAAGDRTFAGTVYYVSPAVATLTRTVQVKARVRNPEKVLLPGMSAEVHVATGRIPRALVVPEIAVRTEAGEKYVWLVSGGSAHRVRVETGPRPKAGRIVVEGELAGGNRVVVGGFQKVAEGTAVSVRGADPAGEGP